MSSNKKYWRGVEELNETSPVVEKLRQNEFVEEIPTDEFLGDKESLESSATSRRDFLKFVGFSTAAASLAACEGPVTKTIPYVVQPDRIVPGVANYYATTMADGFDFASVLVKTREGRPIKIESNKMAKASLGANARVHASVLSLYDNQRIKRPQIDGEDVSKYPIYLRTKKFKVGYVPQYGGFFNDLTLHDNLKAISEIVIEDKNLRGEKIDYLLSKFELENIKNIRILLIFINKLQMNIINIVVFYIKLIKHI